MTADKIVRRARSQLLRLAAVCAALLLGADVLLRLLLRDLHHPIAQLALSLDTPLLTLVFGGFVAFAVADLNDRAREALVEAERQTIEQARLEGALLVSREIAHRLRNYLTVVNGTLEHLADESSLDPRTHRLVLASLESTRAATIDLDRLEQLRRVEPYIGAAGPSLDLPRSTGRDASVQHA
ncbi:MAG: hypothetical protein NZ518_04450 [Dehalococcoidia bacterium]|nr:hypothetical protein [Dehalococcoidia bacterium]